jgi:ABC-type transport system involved in cytochrome bd biosynthesis fused ATPase/permease subunit
MSFREDVDAIHARILRWPAPIYVLVLALAMIAIVLSVLLAIGAIGEGRSVWWLTFVIDSVALLSHFRFIARRPR